MTEKISKNILTSNPPTFYGDSFLCPQKQCLSGKLTRLITARQYGKGVRTNCSYSFCCRAGVYLPPFSLHISFVFGGSKPPPYKVAVGKTCFMEDILFGCFFIYPKNAAKVSISSVTARRYARHSGSRARILPTRFNARKKRGSKTISSAFASRGQSRAARISGST